MSMTDYVIPVLVFILVIRKVYLSKVQWYKKENIFEIIIGILIMGFSIWSSLQTSDASQTLNSQLTLLLEQRTSDSSNNASFQRYLKDSIGLERKGNKASIVNQTAYNLNVQTTPKEKTLSLSQLTASENYGFKFSTTGDSLIVYPKAGIWIKPFLSYETSLESKNQHIFQESGIGTSNQTPIVVRNKEYIVSTIFTTTTRSNQRPLIIDISGARNQSIFFGDDADAEKRYLFEKGKIYWVPNTSVGQ